MPFSTKVKFECQSSDGSAKLQRERLSSERERQRATAAARVERDGSHNKGRSDSETDLHDGHRDKSDRPATAREAWMAPNNTHYIRPPPHQMEASVLEINCQHLICMSIE